MRTLDEITVEIAKFHDALNAANGEIALAAAAMGMTPEEFEKAYDAIAFEDATKLDAYLHTMEKSAATEASAQAMVDQWEARIQEWKAKVKAEQKRRDWMKSRLKFNMEAKGETKLVTAEGRVITIQKNGGSVPVIYNDDCFNNLTPGEIGTLEAEGYVVMQPIMDKAMIRKALEEGRTFDFAQLGERGTQLRIK